MKKFLIIVAATAFVCSSAYAYKDGEYTGEAMGKEAKVVANVTIKGGKITAVKLTGSDTPGLWDAVRDGMPAKFIKAQSADVKAISGASLSSGGAIGAVKAALEKAK